MLTARGFVVALKCVPDDVAHRVDSALLRDAAGSADAREGVAAWRDRRPPDFPMRVPDDLPPAYPWWDTDERSDR